MAPGAFHFVVRKRQGVIYMYFVFRMARGFPVILESLKSRQS